jgi:hypothetical protein
MTRYKSRVARRSRRRARRGTRKQSGGFVSSLLGFLGFGPKPTTAAPVAAAVAAAPAAATADATGKKSLFSGLFGKNDNSNPAATADATGKKSLFSGLFGKNDNSNPAAAADTGANSPANQVDNPAAAVQPSSSLVGGRKTRHRRRSPRRHRK